MSLYVVGIDPGPVPGLVCLAYTDAQPRAVEVYQCLAADAPDLLRWRLLENGLPTHRALVALERFVVSGRAGRSSTASAGATTRDLIGRLTEAAEWPHPHLGEVNVVQRNAGAVKPWATDERLDAAGLLEPTKGMRHARDAARHALYAAVKDGGIPDPLSKRSGATAPPEES